MGLGMLRRNREEFYGKGRVSTLADVMPTTEAPVQSDENKGPQKRPARKKSNKAGE